MLIHLPDPEIEKQITSLLAEHEEPRLVGSELRKIFASQKLNLNQFETLGNFFLNAGLASDWIEFFVEKSQDDSEIPWGHIVEGLFQGLTPDELSPSLLQEIYLAAEMAGATELLTKTTSLDEFRPEVAIQRKSLLAEIQTWTRNRRQEIREKLEIYRTQNLFEEEEKVLHILMLIEPGNIQLIDQRMDLRHRMAQELLAKRLKRRVLPLPSEFIETPEPETLQILSHIVDSMFDSLKTPPSLATDFTVALLTWESPEQALRMAQKIENVRIRYWIIAEIFLLGRRFYELLEHLDLATDNLNKEAEDFFAENYLRAQSLWGLKRRHEAISLLEQIVEARPLYRSGQALLTQWKEELIWLNESS